MDRSIAVLTLAALAIVHVAGASSASSASGAPSTPVTTIITHGFQLLTTSKPDWMLAMGEQVLSAAGGQGSILRYTASDGAWHIAGGSAPSPNAPLVLLFNWADESDGASIPGTNIGYAEAAADALYAALRAPHGDLTFDPVTSRLVHVIGHSRGCCVNSEVVRRLGGAGLPVDQMTNLDPHPVAPPMTESCGLGGGGLNWGDAVPVRWSNVTWADNYWRSDAGLPGLCHDCDFNGMALPAAQVYNVSLLAPLGEASGDSDDCLLGCRLEHSKTHVWYHGTIAGASADPDCAVNASGSWYANAELGCASWICAGYAHSAIAGGPRSPLGAGTDLTPSDVLYNGGFELSYAGWLFHGGGGAATVVTEAGTSNHYARLEPTKPSRTHNRFFLPNNASELKFDLLVVTASADDVLQVRLIDDAGQVHSLAAVPLTLASSNWLVGQAVALGSQVPKGQGYRLEFMLVSPAGGLTAVVGVDRIAIAVDENTGPLGDLNHDGLVDGADLGQLLGSWGPCAGCGADLNTDGIVDGADLGALLGNWTA